MEKKKTKAVKKKHAHRLTKCTPELTVQLVEYLKQGMYIEQCCDLVGINQDSFYEYMKRGARGEEPFKTFSEAVKIAIAGSEHLLLKKIQRAADSQWQAAAWMLERRWPKKWGKIDTVEHGVSEKSHRYFMEKLKEYQKGQK